MTSRSQLNLYLSIMKHKIFKIVIILISVHFFNWFFLLILLK